LKVDNVWDWAFNPISLSSYQISPKINKILPKFLLKMLIDPSVCSSFKGLKKRLYFPEELASKKKLSLPVT